MHIALARMQTQVNADKHFTENQKQFANVWEIQVELIPRS